LAALRTVISWYSYVFHFLLALWLLGLAGIALASGAQGLHLEMLPFSASSLKYIVLACALFALLSIFVAIAGRLRWLFLLWTLAVAVLLTKGYVFSSYRFGIGEVRYAAYLIAATWLAVVGAWFQWRGQTERGPRKYRLK
jgi:hypothetical protein